MTRNGRNPDAPPPRAVPAPVVRATAAGLLAPLLLCSCYVQKPLGDGQPAPSQQVVVVLTDAGAQEMTRWVGPGVTAVEGTAGGTRADTLELRVRSTTLRNGEISFWQGEPVLIPRSAVASIAERRLDRRRSFLLAGGIAVGAVVLARLIGLSGVWGTEGGGGPVPPQ